MRSPEQIEKLEALGLRLAKKRSEAIEGRESSGIETCWQEDQDFYQGVDELNRNEHANAWRTKPPGAYQTQAQNPTRSTVFTNITLPYVNAASARVADMLLPSDDRNFAIRPTPIPDLVGLAVGKLPAAVQRAMAGSANPQAAQALVANAQNQAAQMLAAAKESAEKAQLRIDDWLVECQYHAEVRKMIEDCARIGTGILKGPIPVKRKQVAVENGQLVVKVHIRPGSKRISPWDFYPDPNCGEDIHNGAYTFERDRLTPRKLSELKGSPGYLSDQIDACLEEGPTQAVATTKKDAADTYVQKATDDKRFEIWYAHVFLDKEDLEATGCKCPKGEQPQIPAVVTLVNNRPVRASLNPLDTGDFPYDLMPWQRREGMPWGSGVARNGRSSQRIVLASVRNMMDNGGLSAGPQIVLSQGAIVPADGQWAITPRKVWFKGPEADIDDVRKAMHFFEIPVRQAELMSITQFGLKMMEDTTSLPMILQGQLGKAPDTVGGMTLLNNNANAVLRRLARTFDECITEPHIRRYYRWLMQYGEDEEKGDFEIQARGSSSLVERDIQAQEIAAMGNIAANPVYGIDPKKWATELLRMRKFDPSKFQFDDPQWQQIVANLAQKAPDMRLEVEKLKQEGEAQRQQAQIAADKEEQDQAGAIRVVLGKINERIASIKATGAKEISFEELKADLAGLAMKLSTQKEIASAEIATDVHKDADGKRHETRQNTEKQRHEKVLHASKQHHEKQMQVLKPPVEPKGRAPKGQSFAR